MSTSRRQDTKPPRNPRGQPRPYQRKDGRWAVTVRMADGRPVTKYAASAERAQVLRDELLEARNGARPVAMVGCDLSSFLRFWIESRDGLRPNTLRLYDLVVRTVEAHAIGAVPMAALGPADMESYLHDIGRTRAPRTVGHHRAVIRTALVKARRWGYVTSNAAADAEPPKVRIREVPVLTPEQVGTLLRGTQDSRWAALWLLAATTGMRQGELLGLSWAAVDLDRGIATVTHQLARVDGTWKRVAPKTSRSARAVPLSPLAVAALRRHHARQAEHRLAVGYGGAADGLVFTTSRDMPLHGSTVVEALHDGLEAAGLPRVSFHSLRHTACASMLEAGVPPSTVAELVGHSSVRLVMETYGRHVSSPRVREAVEALSARVAAV